MPNLVTNSASRSIKPLDLKLPSIHDILASNEAKALAKLTPEQMKVMTDKVAPAMTAAYEEAIQSPNVTQGLKFRVDVGRLDGEVMRAAAAVLERNLAEAGWLPREGAGDMGKYFSAVETTLSSLNVDMIR